MPRRARFEALPINAGNQPLPLRLRHGEQPVAGTGPAKTALMQAPLTEPYAGAVPLQQLEPRAASITKSVSRTIAGRAPKCLLDIR